MIWKPLLNIFNYFINNNNRLNVVLDANGEKKVSVQYKCKTSLPPSSGNRVKYTSADFVSNINTCYRCFNILNSISPSVAPNVRNEDILKRVKKYKYFNSSRIQNGENTCYVMTEL